MSAQTFYITTPIYYPSGEPHLGHAYTTICADALARFHRLRGDDTFFLTGTDEHGQKMVNEAAKAGIEPAELAERMMSKFRGYFDEIGVTYDDFIRTSQPRHKSSVQQIVNRMLATGDIYLGSYSGWYDVGQEEFVTETEAKANSYKSPISGRPLVKYEEPSYFFRLRKYVQPLRDHIRSNPEFILPASRRNEVLSKLEGFDQDLSISRASLKWGVEMPNDPKHVVYVWIDALSNYVTALGFASGDESRYRRYWASGIASSRGSRVHLIGKEILWFHTVYWPAMLMSLGEPLPTTVYAHGWWVAAGEKMSKSLGNFIGLDELRRVTGHYGLDALRYYLLRAAPFGADLDWRFEELHKAYLELANVLGNGLNRVLRMTSRYREGVLHDAVQGASDQDRELVAKSAALAADVTRAYQELRLQDALVAPLEVARAMNAYIDTTEPFKLAKDGSQRARLDAVLGHAAAAIYRALVALLPVLPERAAAGLGQLNVDPAGRTFEELMASPPGPGHKLGAGEPLFPRKDPLPAIAE